MTSNSGCVQISLPTAQFDALFADVDEKIRDVAV